jgi:arylsulfatase A
LIASWPGTIAAGSTCDDLVHVQDFGPTLVEVAGGDPARLGPCDGRSFAPRLRGEAGNPRAWFVGSGAHESVWLERVAKETGQPGLKPYDLSWVRGLRYKLYSDGRFYDLETDMAEEHRIAEGAGGDEAEAVRARSRAVLDEQLKRRAER